MSNSEEDLIAAVQALNGLPETVTDAAATTAIVAAVTSPPAEKEEEKK